MATTLGELLGGFTTLQPQVVAIAILAVFSGIQLLGVRAGGASQEILSLAKAVAFIALVGCCFLLPQPSPLEAPPTLMAPKTPMLPSVVLAMQALITTYDGWASPMYFAEEFNDPRLDIPRSLIGGVLVVLVLYLLINAALIHVLPIAVMAQAQLPAAITAAVVLGRNSSLVITGVALVALLSLINTVVMAAPRILCGLGREGLMPSFIAEVSHNGTPILALLLTGSSSILLILTGSFEQLMGIGAFLYVALPLSGLAALVNLCLTQPELQRPFRCCGYPVTPLLVGAISLGFLAGAVLGDRDKSLVAMAFVGGMAVVTMLMARLAPTA